MIAVPSHPRYVFQQGSRSRSILLVARDVKAPSEPKSGLVPELPGASAYIMRVGEDDPIHVRLSTNTVSSFIPGGWIEVDPDLAPGIYRFGVPNRALTSGSSSAMLMIRFPGAIIEPVEFLLGTYDPQEAERIGMECQVWEERQAFLRQGLARLAEMEVKYQEEAANERDRVKATILAALQDGLAPRAATEEG
jgi:hypothetical protein